MAEVSVGIGISLPPIVIGGPPQVVVLPDTNGVYVVPYIEVDLFSGMAGGGDPMGRLVSLTLL